MKTYILPVSARSREALGSLAEKYRSFLTGTAEDAGSSLDDICYSASVRRAHHEFRLSVIGGTRAELAARVDVFLQGALHAAVSSGQARKSPKIAFVFSGQGSQWVGMGHTLLEEEPVFRNVLTKCDEAGRECLGWSLFDAIADLEHASKLDDISSLQPILFSIQVALAALWRSWGIEPDAVVGHSMGEIAAAHLSGALTLPDALRLVSLRSHFLARKRGQGAMAVVELAVGQVSRALAAHDGRVSIAALNSPKSIVISGDAAVVSQILGTFENAGVSCHTVNTDVAGHCHHIDSLLPEFREALRGIEFTAPSTPFYSSATTEVYRGRRLDVDYWLANLREPVRFSAAIEKLIGDGYGVFLEISPHPILAVAIRETARNGAEPLTLASLRRDEGRAAMLRSLAVLYTCGARVDWSQIYVSGRCVTLPSYPWQWQRFGTVGRAGLDETQTMTPAKTVRRQSGCRIFTPASQPGTHVWETEIDPSITPYLRDHCVEGVTLFPAAAFLDLVLAAAADISGDRLRVVEAVAFREPMSLPDERVRTAQISFSDYRDGQTWQFFSRRSDEIQPSWTLHASGVIRDAQADSDALTQDCTLPREIQARCSEVVEPEQYYRSMLNFGLDYGPSFRGILRLWRRDGEAIAQVGAPDALDLHASPDRIHPALLDACLQALLATLSAENLARVTGTFVPIGVQRVGASGRAGVRLWSHARIRQQPCGTDDLFSGEVTVLDECGAIVMEVSGLSFARLESTHVLEPVGDISEWCYEIQWERRIPVRGEGERTHGAGVENGWLLLADEQGVAQRLHAFLIGSGQTCEMIRSGAPDEARLSLAGFFQRDPRRWCGIVDCRPLDSLPEAEALGCARVLSIVQGIAELKIAEPPHLWILTRCVYPPAEANQATNVQHAPLWGLARVVMQEHPELGCRVVDLCCRTPEEDAQGLFGLLMDQDLPGSENQLAIRSDGQFVPRLTRVALSSSVDGAARLPVPPAGNALFRLEIAKPGDLGTLSWRPFLSPRPRTGEVQIEVRACGLNFKDVLHATGVLPPPDNRGIQLGWECSGRIAAVGPGVNDYNVGDEVIALASPSFGAVVTTPTCLVAKKPAHLTFEEAASIPVTFLTASYSLHRLAHLQPRERVLIHAAAGGVGLAAVQLAQRASAEIFATAGSPQKRNFLAALGIRYVLDSRSAGFANEILRVTGGEGVDVVVNSLSAEFVAANLSVLRSGGRFLELARPDRSIPRQTTLTALQENRAFFTIDLSRLVKDHPELCGLELRNIVQQFADGSLKPLPVETFSPSGATDAFRHMAQAKHIGKVVISMAGRAELARARADCYPLFRSDGTYLIAGGAGGLGRVVAKWMVERGASHLVLAGRSGASPDREHAIDELREAADVHYVKCDVSEYGEVASLLTEIKHSGLPLRGIIHAAGVLDDGILLHLNEPRFETVMAPKLRGAWNLHRLTTDSDLDFFVLFSSLACVLGSPGQGNYAAANAFLDALAHYRRAVGLPALSINWGTWSGVGRAAQFGLRRRAAGIGIRSVSPEEGISVLDYVFCRPSPQVAVIPLNIERWRRVAAGMPQPALLSTLMPESSRARTAAQSGTGIDRSAILAASPGQRLSLLEQYLAEQIAQILRLPSARIDLSESVNLLGLDSLVAVELRNRIEQDLAVKVPILSFLSGVSIRQIAALLADPLSGRPAADAPHERASSPEDILPHLEALSDVEAGTILADLLQP